MSALAPPPLTDNPEPWLQDEAVRPEEKTFSVFDLLLVIAKRKRLVLLTGLVFALLTVLWAVVTPRMYKSTVTILPPEQTASKGMGGSLADLSMALASSEGVSFKSSEEFWASVLKGRSIGEDVINSFNLVAAYKSKNITAARAKLLARTSFDVDRAGLIGISVEDPDKKLAANIANGYVAAMHRLMDNMALTDAQERRNFFTKELAKEKDALADAEYALSEVQKRTGVISLGGQTAQAVREVSDLRAQITSRELQIASMETSATGQNPEVVRLRNEVAADKAELARKESEQSGGEPGQLAASSVSSATLENIRATRDVRFHETLYEALSRQLEASLMDIAREAPTIQIVDDAVPAQKPSGIDRPILVVAMGIFGMVLASIYALVSQIARSLANAPANQPKLQEIRAELRRKK